MLRFYDAWADQLEAPGAVLVVRYEDLHARPDAELRRVLAFVGIDDVAPEIVADAVEFGSFDHMRQLEENEAFASEKLRPGRQGDHDTYKTRRGTVGGHRDELTVEQIARLDDMLAASAASRFGYTGEVMTTPDQPPPFVFVLGAGRSGTSVLALRARWAQPVGGVA